MFFGFLMLVAVDITEEQPESPEFIQGMNGYFLF